MSIATVFESKPLASHRLLGTAAGLGLVAAADQGLTIIERQHSAAEPETYTFDNEGDSAVFVLPGCRTNGSAMAVLLQPSLGSLGPTTYIGYPTRGMPVKQIGQKLLERRAEIDKSKPTSVYAHSMGGLVLAKLMEDDEFKSTFGEIDTLVLDSSPSSHRDIRRGSRVALESASVMRFSTLFNFLSRAIQLRRLEEEHIDGVNEAALKTYRQAPSQAHLYTIGSQGHLMHHAKPDSLTGVARRVYYVNSSYDGVIDTDQAYNGYSQVFGDRITRVQDSARPHGAHASGPIYPELIRQLLTPGQLPGDA